MSTWFAFLHHLAVFVLVSALAVELALFPDRRLRAVDIVYGASAGALLLIGLARVFFFEKGWEYYLNNGFFLAKLGLFVAIGLVSIFPTVMLRLDSITPRQSRWVVIALRAQMAGVVLILLCASLMAKGAGFFG